MDLATTTNPLLLVLSLKYNL